MQSTTILRLGGASAIAGGLLRIANTFTIHAFDAHTLALIYLLTDALLLFGLMGWYASRAGRLGASGVAGFAIAVAGILIIRSADLFPGTGYLMGAAVLLAGLAIMNAPILLRRNDTIVPPLLWLLSLLSAVLSIAFAPFAIASAVLFGAGFICAGLHLVRHTS
jgi:hypothetical protein